MLLTVAALAAALTLPGLAQARTHVAVGIGDQSLRMFADGHFRALKIRKVRYFIHWDAIRHPGQIAAADAFVDAARRSHVRVLMHVSTNDLRIKRAKLPSTKAYRRYVGRLVRHFRARRVREWGVWNEANHKSQPTWRSPRRAAQFFKVMYGLCHRCTIVALDVLDQAGVQRYISRFYGALSRRWRGRARLIGIHNYSDTNRFRTRGTRSIIRTVRARNRRARFWMTETGGVVKFGRSFPCSEKRAARAVHYMFHIARAYRRYVKRLYAYNWVGANCHARFDAGLTRANGSPRRGYWTFKRDIRAFTR